MRRWADICLAFGATESSLPGALAAVSPFLKHHPRYGDGIVLFHDGFPEERYAALARAFPPLRFEPVSPGLRKRPPRLGARVSIAGMRDHDRREARWDALASAMTRAVTLTGSAGAERHDRGTA